MYNKLKSLLFLTLTISLVLGTSQVFAAGPIRVGCIPFENITGTKDMAWISEGVPKAISLELSKNPNLKILEAEEIKRTLSELGIPVGAGVNASNAQKVGMKIGSELIIIGNFQQFGSDLKIDALITEVTSGVIIESQKVTGKIDNVFALQDSLVEAVSNSVKKIISGQSTAPKAPVPVPVPTATAAPASTPPPPLPPPPPLSKAKAKTQAKKNTENEATRDLISKQQKKSSPSFSQSENDATRQLLAEQSGAGTPADVPAAVPVAVTPAPVAPTSGAPATVSRSQEDQATKELMQETKSAATASEWYNKGVRLNNNSDEEMAYYRESIRTDPTFAPPYFNLGSILYDRGMIREATENFEKYIIYSKNPAEKARVQEILQKINSNQPAAPETKVNTPAPGPDQMPVLYEDKGPGIKQP